MTKLIFRKSRAAFFSIENVFQCLLPMLNAEAVELPNESAGLWKRVRNILFLRKHKGDVVHITGHDHYLLWWPFKKAILTIHDIEALKRKTGLKKWIFKKLWFDIPIRNASLITTISNFSKEEILALGNYRTPIEVIYNPSPYLEEVFKRKPFNKEKPVILHIGLKKNKNLERLLEALKGLRCKLVVIGKPSEKLIRKAVDLSIEVEFRTGLTNAEVITSFQNADILSFVSTYEGFGLPILEAQAVGVPVITSSIASMPEVAGDGALLVNPYSVDSIKEGIQKVIDEESLREGLIIKGLENIKRFEPRAIANQYLEIYKKVING